MFFNSKLNENMASDKIRGKYIADKTLVEAHFDLTAPTTSKDPATKEYVDNKLSFSFPQGTIAQFRTWLDANIDSFNITDAQKSGLFKYDPTDNQSADDNVMTLIKDAKRFKREFSGWVDVKWFGAVGDGKRVGNTWTGTDATTAIQSALNFANDRGLGLMFNEGVYLISNTIKPKRVNSRTDYRLSFFGKGKGVTKLQGVGDDLINKNLIEIEFTTGDSTAWNDSNIRVHDMSILAGKANRCLYMNKVINVEIDHIEFRGGEIECLKVGDGSQDNFALYIHNNYFNTNTFNGGQNIALMNIDSHFAEIYNNVGDGGFYALNCSLNQMYIAGNTFEGYKFAGVYAKSSGGGNSKIIGNTLRPYTHFDINARFNGTQHGIYIESVSGGLYGNAITGNQIFLGTPDSLDNLAVVSSYNGMVPNSTTNIITGNTSGATGRLLGYNSENNTIQFSVISGTFLNESITQAGTGGTAVIASFVEKHTYGISLVGSIGPNGSNIVTGNNINGAEWGINITSPYNSIVGNNIASSLHGIITTKDTFVTSNNINLYGAGTHIALKKVGLADVTFTNNKYTGILEGIDPQMFSYITTAQRDALVTPTKGLILYDTTVNKLTSYNGTFWSYIESTPDKLLSSKSIGQDVDNPGNLNNETGTGTISWGPFTTNTGGFGFGTAFTITGNTVADPWTQQFLFETGGGIQYRQRIHTYGTWSVQKIWTSRNQLPLVPIVTQPATTITGAPTEAQYNALVAKFNSFLQDYNNFIQAAKNSGVMASTL